MSKTSIQWTDHSINPIRARNPKTGAVGHYCELAGTECKNCYASNFQKRVHMPAFGAGQHRKSVEVFLDEAKLLEVVRRRKPTKYFWCDMTDIFGAWVETSHIDRCFAAMVLADQHVHQVLTKRSARLMQYMNDPMTPVRVCEKAIALNRQDEPFKRGFRFDSDAWPPPNIWCGVSAGNQEQADARVAQLLSTKAAVRFVSAEPLLSRIEMPGLCFHSSYDPNQHDHTKCAPTLDWIIIGGESGNRIGARACELDWVRDLIAQCDSAGSNGVACFVKQLGRHPIAGADVDLQRLAEMKDPKGGDIEEWPEDLRVRQFPAKASVRV